MYTQEKIWLARGEKDVYMDLTMANRHGLIAGATGTGKTITVKVLAESFSDAGVPVFLVDAKGDLAGMCLAGEKTQGLEKRLPRFGLSENMIFKRYPSTFWDVFGENGLPLRTTISEMGPVLLSHLLGLTQVQQGVLDIVFRVADDQGMLLLDLKDLRMMLQYIALQRAAITMAYGNVSSQSVGAIQRSLLRLEDEGGELFFGEPSIDISDWIKQDGSGRGMINILDAQRLMHAPTLYSAFMLYLLSELFEQLDEVGDCEKPRMVFFFDEAHLLFNSAPKALVQKIEQTVKLIRSKGIGVYFITQNPSDIPDPVLAQLSNRVQHALRAYTPSEQKALRSAAQAFRTNPSFSSQEALTQLAVGEALVSLLDEGGVPCVVERAYILPPQSAMGAIPDFMRAQEIHKCELTGKYAKMIDRESAYELLTARAEAQEIEQQEQAESQQRLKDISRIGGAVVASMTGSLGREVGRGMGRMVGGVFGAPTTKKKRSSSSNLPKAVERTLGSAMNTFGREIGKSLSRGLFGSLRR